jgi:hypothetical protein
VKNLGLKVCEIEEAESATAKAAIRNPAVFGYVGVQISHALSNSHAVVCMDGSYDVLPALLTYSMEQGPS